MQFLSFSRSVSGATFLFFALLFCFSCKRKLVDNSLPRTEESMMRFQNILTDAHDGWNVCIVDKNSNYWHFWMLFHEDGKVEMKGDITAMTEDKVVKATANTVQSSQYAVRALQQPTLTFATYNYISSLADPNVGRGRTLNVDIQYAFSEDLVKNLVSTAETSLQSFALQGRLHDSKAYFTRVDGNGIVAEKSLAIQLKLAALRWKDSASVNVITKGSAINTNSGFTNENIFLSDLHLGFGASVYRQVLGLTAFNRKGAAMIYYIDCEGNFRFSKAKDNVKIRRSFADDAFSDRWTAGFYKDFRWANLGDRTKLLFTHNLLDGSSEELAFESRHISDLGSVLGSLQSKADEDTALFGGRPGMNTVTYLFRGFTTHNIRDEWNLRQNGLASFIWGNGHFADTKEPFINIVFFLNGGSGAALLRRFNFGPLRALAPIEHPNKNAYNFKFRNPNMYFLRPLNRKDQALFQGEPSIRDLFLRQFIRFNMVYNFFSGHKNAISGRIQQLSTLFRPKGGQGNSVNPLFKIPKVNSGEVSNVYTLLPTILGFQLHRLGRNKESRQKISDGILAPLYFFEDVD